VSGPLHSDVQRTFWKSLFERFGRLRRPVSNLIGAFWLCGFCTVLFLLGAWFFLANDQGLDFLRTLAEAFRNHHGLSLRNAFFFLGIAAWSLSTWYCARLLLSRRFPAQPVDLDATKGLRTWLPRIAGGLVPIVVSAGFFHDAFSGKKQELVFSLYVLAAIYAVLGIVLFVLYWKRRQIFVSLLAGTSAAETYNALPPRSLLVLKISFALSWGLVALFLVSPVTAPRAVGAPALLLFAAASWILFGSMVLTYWPMANAYPPFTLPLLLLAVVFSWFNDNHTLRSAGTAARTDIVRKPAAEHFSEWVKLRPAHQPEDRAHRIVVVAAAGGGIRAAYWTGVVLGAMSERVPDKWHDHLYALSGVSGGSLGASVHAVQLAGRLSAPTGLAADSAPGLAQQARGMLSEDFLSPVFSYLLYADLVQRFLPVALPFVDRARALELSWEKAAAERLGSERFSERFVDLWLGPLQFHLPVLLLNTTWVETGQRAIASNLSIGSDFSDTEDLLDGAKQTRSMPLSSAAHLSARFSYVSPAATVPRSEGAGVWGHVVDGGYFENSGAATAVELLRALQKHHNIQPILVLIRNDPKAPRVCDRSASRAASPEASRGLNEVLSPPRALLNARVARGRLAEEDAAQYIAELQGSGANCERGCVLEFALEAEPGEIDPPLGWSLSESSRARIDAQLSTHERQLKCLQQVIETGRCDDPPGCRPRG
jgi:hypothetical protein